MCSVYQVFLQNPAGAAEPQSCSPIIRQRKQCRLATAAQTLPQPSECNHLYFPDEENEAEGREAASLTHRLTVYGAHVSYPSDGSGQWVTSTLPCLGTFCPSPDHPLKPRVSTFPQTLELSPAEACGQWPHRRPEVGQRFLLLWCAQGSQPCLVQLGLLTRSWDGRRE